MQPATFFEKAKLPEGELEKVEMVLQPQIEAKGKTVVGSRAMGIVPSEMI